VGYKIEVDLDLCQGHAMCEVEGARLLQGYPSVVRSKSSMTNRPDRIGADRASVWALFHASTVHQRRG